MFLWKGRLRIMKKYVKSSTICILFLVFAAAYLSMDAYAADHNHEWYLDDTTYQSISDTQHKVIYTYCCFDCDEEKTETKVENHDLELWEEEYNTISDTKHEVTSNYYCQVCEAE